MSRCEGGCGVGWCARTHTGWAAALRTQQWAFVEARRVATWLIVDGSGRFHGDPDHDDPQLVDLDALAIEGKESAQADVA